MHSPSPRPIETLADFVIDTANRAAVCRRCKSHPCRCRTGMLPVLRIGVVSTRHVCRIEVVDDLLPDLNEGDSRERERLADRLISEAQDGCPCATCEINRKQAKLLKDEIQDLQSERLDERLREQQSRRRQRIATALGPADLIAELASLHERLSQERDSMAHLTRFGVDLAFDLDIGASLRAVELWGIQQPALKRLVEAVRREQLAALADVLDAEYPGNGVAAVLRIDDPLALREI